MGLDNPLHIAFLLIVVLMVFGAKRLPEIGRSLGSGMRGFRDALSGEAHAGQPLAAVAAGPHEAQIGSAPIGSGGTRAEDGELETGVRGAG